MFNFLIFFTLCQEVLTSYYKYIVDNFLKILLLQLSILILFVTCKNLRISKYNTFNSSKLQLKVKYHYK